jgi:hypothetical protein
MTRTWRWIALAIVSPFDRIRAMPQAARAAAASQPSLLRVSGRAGIAIAAFLAAHFAAHFVSAAAHG